MPVGELSALGSALIWACNSVLLRWLSPRADVVALNAVRCLVAMLLLVGGMLGQGRGLELLDVPPGPLVLLLASVLVGIGLGDSLYFHALRLVGVSRGQPISMSYPLITALLAGLFLGEALTVVALVGIALVVVGVYFVATAHRARRRHHGDRATGWRAVLAPGAARAGVLFSLGAAVCWSCSTTLLRPALDHVDPWVATTVRLAAAAAVLQLYTARRLPAVGRAARRDPAFTAGVLLLGLGTASAIALFLIGVLHAGAARGAALSSASPLFGVPIAVLVLKEQVTWRLVCGVGLTMVGVSLILAR